MQSLLIYVVTIPEQLMNCLGHVAAFAFLTSHMICKKNDEDTKCILVSSCL